MTVNLFIKATMFTDLLPWKHSEVSEKDTLVLHIYHIEHQLYNTFQCTDMLHRDGDRNTNKGNEGIAYNMIAYVCVD